MKKTGILIHKIRPLGQLKVALTCLFSLFFALNALALKLQVIPSKSSQSANSKTSVPLKKSRTNQYNQKLKTNQQHTKATLTPPSALQTSKTTLKTNTVISEEKKKAFSMGLNLSYSQNFYEASQYEKSNSLSLEVSAGYKISDLSSISALTYLIHDLKDREHPVVLKSTGLTWTLTQYTTTDKKISFKPAITGVLPTNQIQYESERYRGGLGVKGSLKFSTVFGTATDITLASAVRKNFHEYTQNADGADLTEYSFPQDLIIDYQLTDKIGFSALSRYILARSYLGATKQNFLTDISLSYAINKTWNASIGVSNEGSAFKADGVQSNFRYFDDHSSEIYLGIGLNI